jgi:hypothetical protein
LLVARWVGAPDTQAVDAGGDRAAAINDRGRKQISGTS